MSQRCSSLPSDPIAGATSQIHHRKDPKFVAGERVEHAVGEPLAQSASNGVEDDGTRVWMLSDRLGAATHVGNEGDPQAGLLKFVLLGRVVEFALGQLVERDAHRSDPSAGLAKYFVGGTAGQGPRVQRIGSALRLFRPDAGVLVRCQVVKTLEQTLGEPSPALGVELQHRGLKVFDLHRLNSTPDRPVLGSGRHRRCAA